jgi:hypothetical protein
MGTLFAFGQSEVEKFTGNWSGELRAYNKDSLTMTVQMGLDVVKLSDSSYQWKISYQMSDTSKRDIRDYLLYYDEKKEQWAIDEKNGIVMYANLIDGALHSCFSVGGANLLIRYSLKDDMLVFDLFSYGSKVWESGTEDGTFQVLSYPVGNVQKAILEKRD